MPRQMESSLAMEASTSQSRESYDSDDPYCDPCASNTSVVCYDLISFLEACQNLNIDLLPISWQPALDALGVGGQAEVRQSLVNLAMSFAFSRVKIREDHREVEQAAYRALLSQISILGHSEIRSHPNIINLVGVCWDIRPQEEVEPRKDRQAQDGILPRQWKVWPVLVFEKTRHGDLACFMSSKYGRNMGITERLKLCADIARGIGDLHRNRK